MWGHARTVHSPVALQGRANSKQCSGTIWIQREPAKPTCATYQSERHNLVNAHSAGDIGRFRARLRLPRQWVGSPPLGGLRGTAGGLRVTSRAAKGRVDQIRIVQGRQVSALLGTHWALVVQKTNNPTHYGLIEQRIDMHV